MKKIITLLAFSFILITSDIKAQVIKVDQVPVKKLANFYYMGSGPKYFYFGSSGNTINAYDRNTLSLASVSTYILDKDNEYPGWASKKVILDDKLYLTANISEVNETNKKYYTHTVSIYQFDPKSGKKLKVVRYGDAGDTADYSAKIDTTYKRVVVKREDSIVKVLNLELDEIAFNAKQIKKEEMLSNPSLLSTLGELAALLATFNLEGFSFSMDVQKFSDSTSLEHFTISYEKNENKDIPYFKGYLSKVNIKSNHKENKVKDVDVSIDVDKTIIDLMYKADANGDLIVIGKYMIKGGRGSDYGLFSCKYDRALNMLSPVKYYELGNIVVENNIYPNDKYVGFIFDKFSSKEHEFKADNGVTVYLFQHHYSNELDHIYIMKVEQNGELIISFVPMCIKLNPKSSSTSPASDYIAFMIKNKLYFIFYDDRRNLDLPVNDYRIYPCKLDKYSVIVSCVYDIESDDVSKKAIATEIREFKNLPDFNKYGLDYNPETQVYTCLIPGQNKKSKTVVLYRMSISE